MTAELGRVLPVVTPQTTVIEASRLLVESGSQGVIVAGRDGAPASIVLPIDLLRLFVPEYIVEDPTLARVLDDADAAEVMASASARTIRELFDDDRSIVRPIAVVPDDATRLEIAAELIRARTTVALVKGSHPARFVTLADLFTPPSDDATG